jgi:hypothetical protein
MPIISVLSYDDHTPTMDCSHNLLHCFKGHIEANEVEVSNFVKSSK